MNTTMAVTFRVLTIITYALKQIRLKSLHRQLYIESSLKRGNICELSAEACPFFLLVLFHVEDVNAVRIGFRTSCGDAEAVHISFHAASAMIHQIGQLG